MKTGRTNINHRDHGHAISGPEGKKAREICRRELQAQAERDQEPEEEDLS